jgi:sensor histidine kinase YesM
MKEKKPYKVYHITIMNIIWSLIPGFLIVIIFYPSTFLSLKWTSFVILYSISLGIPIQKINEYVEFRLDESLPWLKNPGKRLFLTSLSQFIIGIAILLIVNYILYIFIRKTSAQTYLKESLNAFIYLIACVAIFIPVTNSFIFFKSWKQSAINEEILKREKLGMEYESLKNQVNPHFFFNSLSALISLVKTDQQKAVEFIEQFSKIFRYRLEYHQNQVVDLLTEKKVLDAVVFLYKIRFEKEIIFHINLPETIDIYVIPMALQMLVENAIKHNLASIEKPLIIDIWIENNKIIVRNNIQLKRTEIVSNKLGLQNIQSQYKYLSKNEVSIEKTDEYFTVKLPILNTL